jgi:rsbT co-antagonist protein RsbR
MPRTLLGKGTIFGLVVLIAALAMLAAMRAFTPGNLLLLGVLLLLITGLLAWLERGLARPLRELSAALARAAQGDASPISVGEGPEELLALRQSASQLIAAQRERLAAVEGRERALAEERDRLRGQLAALEQSSAERRSQATSSDQLSAPILPVLNGVLVAPIVGIVDELRADFLQKALLEAIQSQRARVAILDLTGLISVDPFVIKTLLQSAQSAKLLGAQPIIVGITPEVAEVLVQLGLQLREIMIMADLQAAVSFARTFIYKSGPATKPGA